MKIQLATKPLSELTTEYVVLPIFQEEKNPFNGVISDFLIDNPKFGKPLETQLLYSKNKKLVLIGIGKKKELNFVKLQNWVGTATKYLSKKTKTAALFLPLTDNLTSQEIGEAVAVGAEMALYDPSLEYKSDKEKITLIGLEIVVQRAERGYQDGIKKGQIIAEGINLVRNMGDKPANEMTPTQFLKQAQKIAKEQKLKLTVLDEKQSKRKGMGAFVGVAQGSNEPSYMLALEYKGDIKTKEKWGLVGKGITFDTGGNNVKPGSHMYEMHYDMCGAATVLGTMLIIAKLGLKTNVVGVMPVTENMPGGKAQRPGDIVRTYSGKTAEVLNTDAEGRLILVDGLTYAQRDFKATRLIDLATLTGAILVALGKVRTGVFTNNDQFAKEFMEIGERVGEKYWQMPMDEEFGEMIKGKFGDITNIAQGDSRDGSSITAAKFIEAVVEDKRPWIHLDIAGTAWNLKPTSFRAPGATGVGVKTLVKLIEG
jgi:leucyl aminopeptidase